MVLSEIDQKLVDEGYLWVDEQGNLLSLEHINLIIERLRILQFVKSPERGA